MTKAEKSAEYRKTREGVVTTIYNAMTHHSKQRGHKPPDFTNHQLRDWMLNQSRFEELYIGWCNSGYNKWMKPSCDRTDDYDGYMLSKLKLGTWKENQDNGNIDRFNNKNMKQSTVVAQYSLEGEFVREFMSVADAARTIGRERSNIRANINGKTKHCGGFLWKRVKAREYGQRGSETTRRL